MGARMPIIYAVTFNAKAVPGKSHTWSETVWKSLVLDVALCPQWMLSKYA
jgi:hypothetical protein